MIWTSHLIFIHLLLLVTTVTKSYETRRRNHRDSLWPTPVRETDRDPLSGVPGNGNTFDANVRHRHTKRAKETPTLAPSISFHDLAVLSRGERPNPIEKSIGAIFSKVAFAPHVARYEEVQTTTSTTLAPSTQPFIPKFVTPRIGLDLDKWGFPGFKPKDPFIIDRTTRNPVKNEMKTTTSSSDPTTVTTTASAITSSATPETTIIPSEIPTTPPATERPLMRINVPKLVHHEEIDETKTIESSFYDQINRSKEAPPPQVFEDSNEDVIDSREAAFQVHVYTIITLYALLGIYSITAFFQLAASLDYAGLLPRAASVGVILFVLTLAVVRLAHLLHDPYTIEKDLPAFGALVLFDIGFPCLSSALSLIVWSLMRTTELQILPKSLQSFTSLLIILVFHFVLTLAVDIAGAVAKIPSLHLASQAIFVLWMLSLCLGYFAAFGPISKAAKELQVELEHYSTTRPAVISGLVAASRCTLAASVISLGIAACQLCSLFGTLSFPWNTEENILQKDNYWSWWSFQLISRLIEVAASALLVTIVSQPQSWRVKKKESPPASSSASDVYSRKIVDYNYQASCGSCRGLKPCSVRTKEYIVVPVTERSFGSSTNSSMIPPSVTYECAYGCSAYQRPHDRPDQQYESIDEISKTVRYKNACGTYGDKVHLHGTGRCHACEVSYKYQTGELTYANERSPTESANEQKQFSERVLMDNYAKFLIAAKGGEPQVFKNNLAVLELENAPRDPKNGLRGLPHPSRQGGSPQFSFDSSYSSDGKSLISTSSSTDSMSSKPGGDKSVRIEFV